jgi:hypothetical protein
MALVLRDALIETRPEFRYVLGQLRWFRVLLKCPWSAC